MRETRTQTNNSELGQNTLRRTAGRGLGPCRDLVRHRLGDLECGTGLSPRCTGTQVAESVDACLAPEPDHTGVREWRPSSFRQLSHASAYGDHGSTGISITC